VTRAGPTLKHRTVEGRIVEDGFQADIDAISRLPAVPTILEVVCRSTGMGFAAVARVTSDRWVACQVRDEIAFGLKPGSELKIETTICNEIRQSGEAVIIDHVAEDATYCGHHTPAQYGFQSYISMPIMLRGGQFFGTLCAIDPKPAKLKNPQVIGMFKLFAELIAVHLDANEQIWAHESAADEQRAAFASTQADLLDAQKTAELREQFIAVLGHDLRNPLASIAAGVRLLQKEIASERGHSVAALMNASVDRMTKLVDNVMDFARARLGGGWSLDKTDVDLRPVLEHAVNELRTAHPERQVITRFELPPVVHCDPARIAQMFSNLVSNAMTHGASQMPVRVGAHMQAGELEFIVSNSGDPIAPETLKQIFQPYTRGGAQPHEKGLGLGLYIASEIAKAHDGTLTATSSPKETRFTFRMKLR
jgi:signal transduction histidine kinase